MASVETTGFDRVEIKTEETEATIAQSAAVVQELAAAPAELSTAVGATKEEQVEITAVQTVTVAETPPVQPHHRYRDPEQYRCGGCL